MIMNFGYRKYKKQNVYHNHKPQSVTHFLHIAFSLLYNLSYDLVSKFIRVANSIMAIGTFFEAMYV